MNNEQRAAAAKTALKSYVMVKGRNFADSVIPSHPCPDGWCRGRPAKRVDYARDLLVDLLHFIEAADGLSYTSVQELLTATETNYEREVLEEILEYHADSKQFE